MTLEEQLLLKILSDFCRNQKSEITQDVNLNELFRLAEEQSLGGVVYIQCASCLGINKGSIGLRNQFISDVFSSVNRKEILSEIFHRFQAAGIPVIAMKGSVFRDYWPVSELRSMGDIDLIIQHADRSKSDEIMLELGYQKMVDNHAVWTYWNGPFMIEIHDHMFYEYLSNRFDYRSYFDRIWGNCRKAPVFGISGDNVFVPEENLHFLYLMTHTAKHIINSGAGFRAYLDMVFFSRSEGLDWEWLEKELERMELLSFTRTCFSLCEHWFSVKMPVIHGKLDEVFFETVTEKTFHDGVFGLENEENKEAHSAKEIRRSAQPYWKGAIRLTFQKLFPPYEDMQLIPWYSWIDGRSWLLPAAWIYRWGYCLVHKRRAGTDLLLEPFVRRKKVEKREGLINDWGL